MKWEYSSADGYLIHELCQKTKLSELLVKILINRGMNDAESIRSFMGSSSLLYDPFLMKDMEKAENRIGLALERGEKIAIFGDYDADGITATVLLYSFLSAYGADVIYALPERENSGYGMNADTVRDFAAAGVRLVVTVDTGITAFEEADAFKEKGIDLIITDHHQSREKLPNAYAVVDPHREDCRYPFKPLAGVGVAFKLVCAIAGRENEYRLLASYADLIALGSIADLVSVTGENRFLIKEGLKKINHNPNEGIRALIEFSGYTGKKITVTGVAYGLAPRINAAGRVATPLRALDLLLSTESVRARQFAQLLCEDNEQRRSLEADIFQSAVSEIEDDPSYADDPVLVVCGENWHQGVIGIVAAKIVEKYKKSTILLTDDGTVAQGSGRSYCGFNILEAINSCAPILNKFGGHEFAAGVQMDADTVDVFRERINAYARRLVSEQKITEQVLHIDSGVELKDVGLAMAKEITLLEPYGSGNSQPVFAVNNVTVLAVESVGKGKHLKLLVSDSHGKASFMLFGRQKDEFPFYAGDHVDIAFSLSVNVWMGRETPSLSVVDIRPSSIYLKADDSLSLYGSDVPPEPSALPVRKDFVDVYRCLDSGSITCFDLYTLSSALTAQNETMTALKLRLILDVFAELGVISRSVTGTTVQVQIHHLAEKVKLEDAPTSVRYGLF